MDSAYYGRGPVHAALAGAAAVSVTVRMNSRIRAAIVSLAEESWTPIEYTNAVFDEDSGAWISRAEVTEIGFTAFAAQRKADHVTGRSWCGGFRTSTPSSTVPPDKTRCSTPGGSTPSSPPPTRSYSTPSRRIRPTAATRSSNRSMPT